jgi:uncharacterized protein YjbJ (UPF0337 family)
MDRQRIEGGLKKATGTVKEKAGQALGDRHLENEGTAEKTEGHVRSAVGKVKDAARDIFKKSSFATEVPAGSFGGVSLSEIPRLLTRFLRRAATGF